MASESSAAYFTDRCGQSIEVKRDTFVPCGLKLGHEGPHEPIKIGKQTVSESPAAKRWDCVVLPDVIDAFTEEEARIEFVQALVEDTNLIRVSEHHDEEADVDA